jgi:hypothetical protein
MTHNVTRHSTFTPAISRQRKAGTNGQLRRILYQLLVPHARRRFSTEVCRNAIGSFLLGTSVEAYFARSQLATSWGSKRTELLRLTGIVQKQPLQIDFVKSAYLFVHRRYRKTRPRG